MHVPAAARLSTRQQPNRDPLDCIRVLLSRFHPRAADVVARKRVAHSADRLCGGRDGDLVCWISVSRRLDLVPHLVLDLLCSFRGVSVLLAACCRWVLWSWFSRAAVSCCVSLTLADDNDRAHRSRKEGRARADQRREERRNGRGLLFQQPTDVSLRAGVVADRVVHV